MLILGSGGAGLLAALHALRANPALRVVLASKGLVGKMFDVPAESAAAYLFTARMLLRQEYDPVAEEYAQKAVALDPKLLAELKQLLGQVAKTIHQQPNRVRGAMNAFVIAVGSYVSELTDTALETVQALERLRELNRWAATCPDLDAFRVSDY